MAPGYPCLSFTATPEASSSPPVLFRSDITDRGCQRQHMASVGSQRAAVVHPLPDCPCSPNRFSIYHSSSPSFSIIWVKPLRT
jgi:hypothetical protein